MSAAVANSIFTASFLRRASRGEHRRVLSELAKCADVAPRHDETLDAYFERIYDMLVLQCRCEYVVKNEIANRIFLARHSPERSTLLTEVRVGSNRADLVIVNGSLQAYEIKTEFDSLARMSAQVAACKRVFPKVHVVLSPHRADEIDKALNDERVGVIVYTEAGALSAVRKASDNTDALQSESIFEMLRMPEYLRAIKAEFGAAPCVPNGLINAECRKLFATIKPSRAAAYLADALKRRAMSPSDRKVLAGVPYALTQLFFEIPKDARAELLAPTVLNMPAFA